MFFKMIVSTLHTNLHGKTYSVNSIYMNNCGPKEPYMTNLNSGQSQLLNNKKFLF